MQRLILNSAEEFSFKGSKFQFHSRCDFEKSHLPFEQVAMEHLMCYIIQAAVVNASREVASYQIEALLEKEQRHQNESVSGACEKSNS